MKYYSKIRLALTFVLIVLALCFSRFTAKLYAMEISGNEIGGEPSIGDIVCYINSTSNDYYTSLSQAMNDAVSGDVIIMNVDSIQEDVNFKEGVTIKCYENVDTLSSSSHLKYDKKLYKIDKQLGDNDEIYLSLKLYNSQVSVYRLYNPGLGVHHYTQDVDERDNLVTHWGWKSEGVVFNAYKESGEELIAVYRLYNPGLSQHLLTSDTTEIYNLTHGWGWVLENDELPCFYLPETSEIGIYRLYNPYLSGGEHLYTTNKSEYDRLINYDWKQEGIVFYGG